MKISELINKLNKLKEKWGDKEVMLYIEDIDDSQLGLDDINEVDFTLEDDPVIYIAHRNNPM